MATNYHTLYSSELVDQICALLAEGRSLREIGALPGLPSSNTITRWKREKPDFAKRCALARAANSGQKEARVIQEICTHVALGQTLQEVCAMPDMPPYITVYDWLQKWPHLQRKMQQARKMNDTRLKEAVLEYLADGRSLRSLCALPGLPARQTVRSWLKTDPEFAKNYEQARRLGIEALADEVLDLADDTTLALAERKARADIRLRLLGHWGRTKKEPEKPAEPERDVLAEVFARIRAGNAHKPQATLSADLPRLPEAGADRCSPAL